MTVHSSLGVSARVRQGSKLRGAEALLVPLEGSGTHLPGRPRPSARDGAAGPAEPARGASAARGDPRPAAEGPGPIRDQTPDPPPVSPRSSVFPQDRFPEPQPTRPAPPQSSACPTHPPPPAQHRTLTLRTRALTEPECAGRGEAGNINRKPLRGLAAPALADVPGPSRSSLRPRVLPARCAGRVRTE